MMLYKMIREIDMPKLNYFKSLSQGLIGWCLLGATASASAEPPMWLVEDEDSKIYLFGTVHLLDADIEWQTERVMSALDEATQLWEEIPMPASLQEAQAAQVPVMLPRAVSPGRPLSSLLTAEEKTQLERALTRTPAPQQLGMVLENMKPWFAIVNLGTTPLMKAGYDVGAGADIVLSRLAHAQGDEVLGFETLEQQLDLVSGWTEEEQLGALRALLAMSDAQFNARIAAADSAFRAWMDGDVAPVEQIIEVWRTGEDALRTAIMPFDVFVGNRNENWAGQIESLLAGEGVAFVAVGAGHLVGPDSVQAGLARRGIKVKKY